MIAAKTQYQPSTVALIVRRCWLVAALTISLLAACTEGNFDQRLRADIEELRATAFVQINTNPSPGTEIAGWATTGGQVSRGRITLRPVSADGQIDYREESILGDGLSAGTSQSTFEPAPGMDVGESSALSIFNVTLRRGYRGPIIVELTSTTAAVAPTVYANPASAASQPRIRLQPGQRLLGYVLDHPYGIDARALSPLSTLVVERALSLGGISSGNLSLASLQVGAFFGLIEARDQLPASLLREAAADQRDDSLETDLVLAAISQLAQDAGAEPAALWQALCLDIRDNGELDGTAGMIPGTGLMLPSLGQPGFVGGELLRNGYLNPNNDENISGISADDAIPGTRLLDQLDYLDTARSLSAYSFELLEADVERSRIAMAPGQSTDAGIRGFTRVAGRRYMVASSEGPSQADFTLTSSDATIAEITPEGRIRIPTSAPLGRRATVSVTISAGSSALTGAFSQTFLIEVLVRPEG